MKPISVLILPFAFIISMSSCEQKNVLFHQNTAIKNALWAVNDRPVFYVNVQNINTPYNFFIHVRNTGAYPYRNLFLFIDTQFPDKKTARDTVECFLADHTGKWYGKGSGNLYDNLILFKRKVIFPQPGIYTFQIEHGMRSDTLEHITDIGLRIEYAN